MPQAPAFEDTQEAQAPVSAPAFEDTQDTKAPLSAPSFEDTQDIPQAPVPKSGFWQSFKETIASKFLGRISGALEQGVSKKEEPVAISMARKAGATEEQLQSIADTAGYNLATGGKGPSFMTASQVESVSQEADVLRGAVPLAFEKSNPHSTNLAAQLGRGSAMVGADLPLMLTGLPGFGAMAIGMADEAYTSAYSAKEDELKASGIQDAETLKQEATKAGDTAAIHTAPALLLYMVTGKLAAGFGSKLAGEAASPLKRALWGTTTAIPANVAAGTVLRAVEAPSGKKLDAMIPSVENLTADTLFGVFHGVGEFRNASRLAKQKAYLELLNRGFSKEQIHETEGSGESVAVLSQEPNIENIQTASQVDEAITRVAAQTVPQLVRTPEGGFAFEGRPEDFIDISPPAEVQTAPVEPSRQRPPEVISTAIRNPDGTVTTGEARETPHKELIRKYLKAGGSPNTEDILDNMGFLIRDAEGNERWATREEAYQIAEQTGQLKEPAKNKRLASEIFQPEPTKGAQSAIQERPAETVLRNVPEQSEGQQSKVPTEKGAERVPPSGVPQQKVTAEEAANAIEPYREAGIAMAKRAGATDVNAEDIFQEVQTDLSRQAGEGKINLSNIGALVSKAVRNKTANFLASEQAAKRGGGKVGTLEEVTTEPAEQRGPRAETVSGEEVTSIEQAISALPEGQSKVMRLMVDNPGISDAEIGKQTGQTEEAVRSAKLRARQTLKEFIRKNKIGERMGPGAANVQEFQRAQFIAASDIYEGLKASDQLDRATWEKNMERIYEDTFTPDELDTAWAVAQEASRQYNESGGRKPMPAIISEYMGTTDPGEGITGIKHADTEKQRRAFGLPARTRAFQKANPKLWDEAMRAIEEDKQLQENLIAELRENPQRAVNDTETAILLNAQVQAENRHARALDEVNNAKDENSLLIALQKARQSEAEMLDLLNINDQAGSVAGSALQARKLRAGRDYSFAPMAKQLQADQHGAPLNEKQEQVVREVSQKIQETQSVLDTRIDTLQQQESQKAFDEAVGQMAKEPAFDSRILRIANQIVAKLDSAANKARERIKARALNFNAGIDPTVIYDLAVIGASKIARGLRDIAWKNSMREEFGEGINPHLDEIFQKADSMIDQMEKEVPEADRKTVGAVVRKTGAQDIIKDTSDKMKARIADGESLSDLRAYVQKIALSLVRSGITTPNELLDAVHTIVEPMQPGLSRRQTMDLISGYGDLRTLDMESAKVQLRDLKGQYQQLSKIEDIKAKIPLQKTGVERRVPSDAERRLIRQVNELKKRIGVVVTDPAKQLKSALDSIKTGLKNQIADLTHQIETGEKPIPGTPAPTDAQVERLKATRDQLRNTLKDLEGKPEISDEQRIRTAEKALERSIADLETRIKNKDYLPSITKQPESAKLDALRSRRDALHSQLDELKAADQNLRDTQAFDRIMKSADELEKRMAKGEIQPETKAARIEDELVTRARDRLNNLQRQMQELRRASPEGQQQRLDAAIESVQKSIADYDARLKSGAIAPKTKAPQPTSPLLERLRAERDAMRKVMNELRHPSKTPSEIEQQKIDQLQKSIRDLDAKIQSGDIQAKPKSITVTSPIIERLRAERNAMAKLVQELRKGPSLSPDEVALKAFKTRTAKQIADIQDRIARGDFAERVRKPLDISKDAEAVRLLAEKQKWIQKFANARHEARKAAETKLQTGIRYGKEAVSLVRSIESSFDFSAVGRQGGWLGASHPQQAAKNIVKMFKATFSDDYYNKLDAGIRNRPNGDLYKVAKLELTSLDGEPSMREENFRSDWGNKIPGIRASNRAFNAYLNTMRADVFDSMIGSLGFTPTTQEARDIARYINIATGRGDFGKLAGAAEVASHVLWSPRLLLSRIQLLTGDPIIRASSNRIRLAIAKEYARSMTGTALFIALGLLAGATLEKDPRSSDFGKIKFGNTRIDPLFGLQQVATFSTRMGSAFLNSFGSRVTSGDIKTSKGKIQYLGAQQRRRTPADPTTNDVIWRFIQSKATPVLGGVLAGIRGEQVTGEPTTMKKELATMYVPMSVDNLIENLKENGFPEGAIPQIFDFLGFSTQTYDPNKKKRRE